METFLENQLKGLLIKANEIRNHFLKEYHFNQISKATIPEDFKKDFYTFVDKVNLSLMEDKDNFFGYFLFQMTREIRFDIASPTAVNFKGAKYIIYFNPIIFLNLNIKQMESTIKHEILHIVSLHLIRAKEYKARACTLAVNLAMDIVVNTYLDYLPPYASTLEKVNTDYKLQLKPYETFEYYVEKIQTAIALLEQEEEAPEDDSENRDIMKTEYDAKETHDIWEDSSDIEEKTLYDFTDKVIQTCENDSIPTYLKGMLSALKNSRGELPWNLYLSRLMGTVESNKKKTITRRSRRQPERLDIRGELRSHKARIVVAIDISGSISDEEFMQAVKEVLSIVKNYNHEITILECDDAIRRVYKVKTVKDIKERMNKGGGTGFDPVIDYCNNNSVNLLVYFTDGKGEEKLKTIPKGYNILWVISGKGEELSLKVPYGAVKKLSNMEIKDNILDASDVERGGYSMNNQESIL